jgi:hypothetical protein
MVLYKTVASEVEICRVRLATAVTTMIHRFFFWRNFAIFRQIDWENFGIFILTNLNSTNFASSFFVKFRQNFNMKKMEKKKNTARISCIRSHPTLSKDF